MFEQKCISLFGIVIRVVNFSHFLRQLDPVGRILLSWKLPAKLRNPAISRLDDTFECFS